jgi:hypothetical protein
MYLVYIDEIKVNPKSEPYYWLCALAFPEWSIQEVELKLASISKSYFGSQLLSKRTEFHSTEIIQGKGSYKGHDISKRVDLFKSLIDVINECPDLERIKIRIDPSKMITSKYVDKAFMFLVEKVDSIMSSKKSLAMLIADHDKDMVASNVSSLSEYKSFGTDYHFGREINNIIDTIHHTHSHHSRLVQLADIYTCCMNMLSKKPNKYPKNALVEYIKTKDKVAYPSKYKYWPTNQSWHKP